MNVAALVFALAGAALNLFQDVAIVPFIGGVSMLKIVQLMMKIGSDPYGRGGNNFGDLIGEVIKTPQGLALIGTIVAPVIALIGGIFAFQKKKGFLSSILLGICALSCGTVFLTIHTNLSRASYETRMMASTFTSSENFLIWAVLYGIASVCASMITKGENAQQVQTTNVSDSPIRSSFQPLVDRLVKPSTPTFQTSSPSPSTQTQRTYEPILGLETDSLIKRAFLFLEDGQFSDAARYLEQALNQDAEDARIHFGQLMCIRKARDALDLVNNLPTLLENEKLFQRALRFADDDYKKQLENLAQASRDKLEQKRLAKEAENERRQAEIEAKKQEIYQKILNLNEKISTEKFDIKDLNEILSSAVSIRGYKDADKIYEKANEKLKLELKYQDVLKEKQIAKDSQNLKHLIAMIEELDGYRDSEELLTQAQEDLNDAEEHEAKTRKKLIFGAVAIMLIAAGAFGFQQYQKYAMEKRIEEDRRRAAIARENLITAFCEGRYEDIPSDAASVDSYNAAIIDILALVEYEKSGENYEIFKSKVKDLQDTFGDSSKDDFSEAVMIANRYLTQPSANKFLGDVFMNGYSGEKNIQKALEHFKIPADNGDVYSQIAMATIYENVLKNPTLASEWYEKLADRGSEFAQVKLGSIFYNSKDYAKAAEYLTKAAENGNPEAQNNLASLYKNGLGVEKNPSKALELYLKAAQQGNAQSQETLAKMYADGEGTPQNFTQAIRWYREAANQGRKISQYELGNIYLEGKNVPKDYTEAKKWFDIADDQNYAPAQDKIGWLYQNGWGVPQDYSKAREYYLKAANQGNPFAQASLGLLYLRGWGVDQDLETALEWYKKAAEKGHQTAIKRVDEIERQLFNQKTKETVNRIERDDLFPVSATIFGNSVNLRSYPNQNSGSSAKLNAGHPVSISRRTSQNGEEWYFVKTASGTEGWVNGSYVSVNTDTQDSYEDNKRKRSLPAHAKTIQGLNVRSIPTAQGSNVIEKLHEGTSLTVYEIFAGPGGDWFRIQAIDYNETRGWVFGKYVEFGY